MYLLNGESKRSIDFSDRGFQYGDGLFETIEVLNGTPVFLKQHLQRLSQGCNRLKIPAPSIDLLSKEACQLTQEYIFEQVVLKLIVTRGPGGRGYRQPDSIDPTRLFSIHPFPEYPNEYKQQGISIRFCKTRLGLNPSLAGIKHMNRLEQIIARAEWQSTEFQEGLMLDMNGNVVEGTMSNVFLIKDSVIYTPVIDNCGVEGIIRNIVIALARQAKIELIEKPISKQQLLSADALFITNSIIGIWPVKQIEAKKIIVDPVIQQLQNLLSAFKQGEINDC